MAYRSRNPATKRFLSIQCNDVIHDNNCVGEGGGGDGGGGGGDGGGGGGDDGDVGDKDGQLVHPGKVLTLLSKWSPRAYSRPQFRPERR